MNRGIPVLRTERLVLRPFTLADTERVQELAGDRRVYETTANIPHPYEAGMAETWIAGHLPAFLRKEGVVFAVCCEGTLTGAIGLTAKGPGRGAEMGYWIGVPYWGNGYCTEAARAVLRFGFTEMQFHKISATHLEGNIASGRVMEKIGLKREGRLVDEFMKEGILRTLVVFGLSRTAYGDSSAGADCRAQA